MGATVEQSSGTVNIHCDRCGATAAVTGVQTPERVRDTLKQCDWLITMLRDICPRCRPKKQKRIGG